MPKYGSVMGVQKGEEKEKMFKEIMVKNFQYLGKDPRGLKDFT